jgi:hypothetical protein
LFFKNGSAATVFGRCELWEASEKGDLELVAEHLSIKPGRIHDKDAL